MIRYLTFLVISITWLAYFSKFYPWNGFPIDKAERGAFGDFVGEVTNPILIFFTTATLIKSINLQEGANNSIVKQNSHMHEVSERQREVDDLRSFKSSFYSFAKVSKKEFDALKITGRNEEVYSAADAVVYLEECLLNACKLRTSKGLTEQLSKLDIDSLAAIFSAARSFYILSKSTNESCPDDRKEGYYETINYIMPVRSPCLICLTYVFKNWKITSNSERYSFFKRKGLDEYVFNSTRVRNYY